MEKRKKKLNIALYTLLMLFVFVFITEGIIYGYGGRLVYNAISNYPQGSLVISEAVLSVMVLIVMLLFKNSYVFTQKKEPFKTGLFYGLFYLIGSGIFFLLFGVSAFRSENWLAILNLFVGSLLIGVCEEFLCRGWLLNEFLERCGETKKGVWYAIVMSGFIFGLMHLGNIFTVGQPVATTITQVINATATGIFFGLVYYKTKNIWSVIFLHGIWDFSLLLNEVVPVTEFTESINSFSVIGIIFSILSAGAILLNTIPHFKDIDAKPKKKPVIILAIVSVVVFIIFTLIVGLFSTKIGETYEYGSISLNNYAVTRDNYKEYTIDYKDKIYNTEIGGSNSQVVTNYLFNLTINEDDKLVLKNLINDSSIEFECESLYDYIVVEEESRYIIAYIDYTDSANAFLNYIFMDKETLSNDTDYLEKLKDSAKKYLLPTRAELLVVSDYENDKTYLGAYHIDYGYYLLVSEDEVSVLKKDK